MADRSAQSLRAPAPGEPRFLEGSAAVHTRFTYPLGASPAVGLSIPMHPAVVSAVFARQHELAVQAIDHLAPLEQRGVEGAARLAQDSGLADGP